MAILALKGHSTRGKEVIEILEMLGGKNLNNLDGASNMYYLIGLIVPKILGTSKLELDKTHVQFQFTYFTLENFLEKYPYKVGDRVTYRADKLLETQVITHMRWDSNYDCVLYYLDNCNIITVDDILYKIGSPEDNIPTIQDKSTVETMEDKDMEEKDKAKAPDLKGEDYSGRRFGYKIPDGYEFDSVYNGNIILKPIKPQYPKTYDECCDILNIETNRTIDYCDDYLGYRDITQYDINLLTQLRNLRKLRIYRDVYWKIAGEQMGLGKPWEPDWCDYNPNPKSKYIITTIGNNVVRETSNLRNYILAFPTAEMRDEFYNNFKELIEECKELL